MTRQDLLVQTAKAHEGVVNVDETAEDWFTKDPFGIGYKTLASAKSCIRTLLRKGGKFTPVTPKRARHQVWRLKYYRPPVVENGNSKEDTNNG